MDKRIKFNVAGTQYTHAKFYGIEDAQEIKLTPEPDNAHDSNAIQVLTSEGMKLGYVPRTITGLVHEMIQKRHAAFVASVCSDSFNISIHVTVVDLEGK